MYMFLLIYFFLYICSTSTSAWAGAIAMVTGMSNVCWKNWNCRGKENLYWNRDWNLFVRKVSTTSCVAFEGDRNNVTMLSIHIRCSSFISCIDVSYCRCKGYKDIHPNQKWSPCWKNNISLRRGLCSFQRG